MLNARVLMAVSAAFMAILGIAGSFLPEASLRWIGAEPDTPTVILVQVTAALYMGFAILNWMARSSVIGGIYGRPVAFGNLLHFAVVAALLIKASVVHQNTGVAVIAAAYTVMAAGFGFVTYTHPGKR